MLAVNKQNNLAKKAVKSCLVPTRLSFFERQERAKDKGKGKGFASPLSLSHGPSRFKLVTSRACFALALTSPLVGQSKRLRRQCETSST